MLKLLFMKNKVLVQEMAANVCGLGMAYAWQDINRIRHSDKISANNNELGASIDSINQQSKNGEGGFTKKLKSVILSEND